MKITSVAFGFALLISLPIITTIPDRTVFSVTEDKLCRIRFVIITKPTIANELVSTTTL